MTKKQVTVSHESVVRLWLWLQGFSEPRGTTSLAPDTLDDHLKRTGALQLDSVNVAERAHYLTLWSRFGPFDKERLHDWVYRDRRAYEYWGHEASILPISHLKHGLRRMRLFPPDRWRNSSWWARYDVSTASKRRVLWRLRREGPMESADFKKRPEDEKRAKAWGMAYPKEDKRALQLLWHAGKVAVSRRRHFRRVYDLAERVYPKIQPVSRTAYEDGWLLTGLSGCGVASEKHLTNYWTAPNPKAADRRRIIGRNLTARRIVEIRVAGFEDPYYVLPEHLEILQTAPAACGTTLICPFDSLLWQRRRVEDLLGFRYRIEIYVPPQKRTYGYYVLPILHDGRLVGRLDPKMHRAEGVLEIKNYFLEEGFEPDATFRHGFRDSLESLASFLGASELKVCAPSSHDA